jgi:hypothetical protein
MTTISSSILLLTINCKIETVGVGMEITTVTQAEETYKQWHRDFVVEEFLQQRTNAEVHQVLVNELDRRNITLEDVQKIVKNHKLDGYPSGLTYSNLSLRADRAMAALIDRRVSEFLCKRS